MQHYLILLYLQIFECFERPARPSASITEPPDFFQPLDNYIAPKYYSHTMATERVQRRIDSLLDEADAAISKYDWVALREASQAVLRLDPENADALAYLAAQLPPPAPKPYPSPPIWPP